MFSARKTKGAPPPRQQSVAPQIDRSTTESSMDDSSPRRRGDVALCCAYVLQGNDWAPVNNSRPDDLTNESRFLAAKIVQDDDMAEAFLELHDYPQTTIIELVVKLKAESRHGQNSDEVSLSFKGEQFQGFSVFASPAPPVRRKSSKDLK